MTELKRRKRNAHLLPPASLTWALSHPWPLSRCGYPRWTGWGTDSRQGAGNRAPQTCTVWFAWRGTESQAPKGWWPNPLTSRTLESHLDSRSPGALVPNSSLLPDSGASLAPWQDAVAQVGRSLEARGEALGGEVLRPSP